MRAFGAVLLFVAACGSVGDSKQPDARVDSPMVQIDAPIDAPQQVVPTAISVGGISTFAAAGQTMTKVLYSSEVYDDGNEFDTSTNRFTAKAAGDYQICASLYVLGTTFELDVMVNDVRERAFAIGVDFAQGCRVVRLAAGDHAEVFMYQFGTTSTQVSDNAIWAWLTIRRIATKVLATGTTQFTAANGAFTKVPYDHEVFDDANTFDTTAQAYSAPAAGDYQFCASLATGTLTGRGEIDLFVNNARKVGFGYNAGAIGGCHTLRLAANDTVDVHTYQATGSPMNIPADANWHWLNVQPRTASVYSSEISAVTLPSGTFVKVPYTSEVYDDNGEFDVGTSTFTAKTAGDYEVCASFDTRSLSYRSEIDVYKNGNREKGLISGFGATGGHCRVMRLAANDQIAIYAYQASGASQSVTVSDPLWDWFQVSKL